MNSGRGVHRGRGANRGRGVTRGKEGWTQRGVNRGRRRGRWRGRGMDTDGCEQRERGAPSDKEELHPESERSAGRVEAEHVSNNL